MNRRIADHYRTLIREYGDSVESVQYSSRESQFRRFAVLAQIGELRGKKILDFGCGMADFHTYLVNQGQTPAHYTGVDLVDDFFPYARSKVPGGLFCHPDALKDARFDYAFVSGVFNNRQRGNRRFWQTTIKAIFDRCDLGVAFNLMSTHVDYRDPGLFYEDPAQAFNFVKRKVSPFVTLRHDYVPKEGSVPFEFALYAYRAPQDLPL